MLRKWFRRFFVHAQPEEIRHTKQEIPFEQHGIDASQISFAAEKVVSRLQKQGFDAVIVGGAVRDLLLGIEPKDFDVATNAKPEEIRKIFRRSRIIGKRFPIVHVMVGPETIEVTTYRSHGGQHHNEYGRIIQDNSYGTQEQDASRRDFTCNALYYNPLTQTVIDYHHGVEDIRRRQLVMIGDAHTRYQEDPVRILRAVRLAGKLGLQVAPATQQPMNINAHLLKQEPTARIFDEIIKIIFSGKSIDCIRCFASLNLTEHMPSLLQLFIDAICSEQNHIANVALQQTDKRLAEGKSVSIGFVLATVLWPQVASLTQVYLEQNFKPVAALHSAIHDVRLSIKKDWGISQKFIGMMAEIWLLQLQFEHRRGRRPFKFIAHQRFRLAYDFLLLRAEAAEVSESLAEWWRAFQAASEEERNLMVQVREPYPKITRKKSRKRRQNKPVVKEELN